MKIDEAIFRRVVEDLIDENEIACSAVLSITRIEFSKSVLTLAVTLGERPVLKVNPDFITEHLHRETDVKAVVLHEFLHVVLNHTERYTRVDEGLNIALDAVINHIIQRSCGEAYGDFFRRYYRGARGVVQLLVPFPEERKATRENAKVEANRAYNNLKRGLMYGRVVADDVLDVVREIQQQQAWSLPKGRVFIGGHEPDPDLGQLSPTVQAALDRTLREMNGGGIFRSPRGAMAGIEALAKTAQYRADSKRRQDWERNTLKILKEFITPDRKSRLTESEPQSLMLPVLNASDRRGFVRALWSPLIPDIQWSTERKKPIGSCQVYLDVSGSMNNEMDALVGLLQRLRRYLRMPFWAFSNLVAPAVIINGELETDTTGGTAMNCVLEHVVRTRPGKAVVITDGYIENCDPDLLKQVKNAGQSIFAIVSRNGSTQMLDNAGIPCRQLATYPEENQ
jgi:hypothetical protein